MNDLGDSCKPTNPIPNATAMRTLESIQIPCIVVLKKCGAIEAFQWLHWCAIVYNEYRPFFSKLFSSPIFPVNRTWVLWNGAWPWFFFNSSKIATYKNSYHEKLFSIEVGRIYNPKSPSMKTNISRKTSTKNYYKITWSQFKNKFWWKAQIKN